MAVKGILFNTEMVKAILDGRKTVTRRGIKPANRVRAKAEGYHQGYGLWLEDDTNNLDKCGHIKDYSISPLWSGFAWYTKRYAPYQPGDILYVRETWTKGTDIWECQRTSPEYFYKADYLDAAKEFERKVKWHPSIHMPKEAARIWLKVTDVRVERLQDITLKDTLKEGVQSECRECTYIDRLDDYSCECYRCRNEFKANYDFSDLWDSVINEKDLPMYGWDANPYVWVIEFKRCEKPKEEHEKKRDNCISQ